MKLPVQVNRTIQQYRLLLGGERVLVAVSGGADSTALLMALKALSRRWSVSLHAFHLNHQLRGEEAEADQELVRNRCRDEGIPFFLATADVRGHARTHRVSLEEAGRSLRYSLLEQTAEQLGCQKIATGHTADDNAETLLMNLIRGSGRGGLAGIPVQRGRVIRPLLETRRDSIIAWLAEQGIGYSTDSSNNCGIFRRNAIRQELMPVLKRFNPEVVAALSRTARILADEEQYLEEHTRPLVRKLAQPSHSGYLVDSAGLLRLSRPMQRRVLRALVPALSLEGTEALLVLAAGPTGRKRTTRREFHAVKDAAGLFVGPEPHRPELVERRLAVPGRTGVPELEVEIETRVQPVHQARLWQDRGDRVEMFDFAGIELPLCVRLRRDGDRMVPFGGREKKLKEILIEDKIPQRLRDRLPVLCDRQGIIWVVGSRRADRARVGDGTRQVLTVSVA